MKYYEIHIKTAIEAIDAVTNILYVVGATGVLVNNPEDEDLLNQDVGQWDYFDPQNCKLDFDGALLTGYFEEIDPDSVSLEVKEMLENLKDFNIPIGLAEITFNEVFPKDWENEWKKYFKPTRIGQNIVIKPSWEMYEALDTDIIIEIDPGNAFGSGTHETTSMCIEMIEKYMNPSDTVVDVGCGSGILAISAGKLGSNHIIAADIDPSAVETAKENIRLNGLSHVTDVRCGNLLEVIPEKADLVVANIIADIIVKLSDDIDQILKQDAIFISSGIILNKADWVVEELEKRNFEIIEVMKKGEWAVVVSKKRI